MKNAQLTEYKRLKEYLSRYNKYTVPDYLYYAYMILLEKKKMSGKKEILDQAVQDLKEEENSSTLIIFNRDRKKIDGIEGKKFNW